MSAERKPIQPPPDFVIDEHPMGQCFPVGTWSDDRNCIVLNLGDGYDIELTSEEAIELAKWLQNAADWERLSR